jgi:hypothetical protein
MRKEMYALLASEVANLLRFFLMNHGNSAMLNTHTTVTRRATGGSLVGVVNTGISCCALARNATAVLCHSIFSGSSTHGALSSNAAQLQSRGEVTC